MLQLDPSGQGLQVAVQVAFGDGQPIGEIVQENVFGKIRFG